MTEDELVYTFALTFTPEVLAGTPITRADGAVVGVNATIKGKWLPALFLVIRKLEDHLFGTSLNRRFHNVSSNALRPTWVPYASTEVGEEVLLFSLKLMMGWCSFFIHSAFWIRLFLNCSSLQMTGPMRGLHTCISWVILLILRRL